VLAE
jgi:hypothetical protein